MNGIDALSAAKLVKLFNLVTKGKAVKKFESQPRALARTMEEIAKAGLSVEQAMALMDPEKLPAFIRENPRPPISVLNLATGETLPRLASLHNPIRTVEGDPEKAARKAVRQHMGSRPVKAAAPQVSSAVKTAGPLRTNKSLPSMLAALSTAEGATLAELTVVSGWGAPVELRNLRILEKKRGVRLTHNGAPGADRRYRIAAK